MHLSTIRFVPIFYHIIFLCTAIPLNATITQVASVREGLATIQNISPTDLIVCDIDHTLTAYHPLPKHLHNQSLDVQLQHRNFFLLDEGLPKILMGLQAKNISVIALTHARTGKFGSIASMEEWRFKTLNKFGLSFKFDKKNPSFLLKEISKPHPSFFKGIILSAHHAKGTVLLAFLKLMETMPKRVFFFDDLKCNIASVHKTLQNIIEVHCFHITNTSQAVETTDQIGG